MYTTGLVEITTDPLEAEETVFAITATQFWAATSRAKLEKDTRQLGYVFFHWGLHAIDVEFG